MTSNAVNQGRRSRADAARNHERVLEAARVVFGTGGSAASLEAVARQAGVGIGTLYRHFPTREALFEAVYRREVEQLSELAERLAREPDTVASLRQWLAANVEFVSIKKGMMAALALAARKPPALLAYTTERLHAAVGGLLARGVAAGALRDDVAPEEVMRALVGICYANDQAGWQESAFRLVDVFVDGLRVR